MSTLCLICSLFIFKSYGFLYFTLCLLGRHTNLRNMTRHEASSLQAGLLMTRKRRRRLNRNRRKHKQFPLLLLGNVVAHTIIIKYHRKGSNGKCGLTRGMSSHGHCKCYCSCQPSLICMKHYLCKGMPPFVVPYQMALKWLADDSFGDERGKRSVSDSLFPGPLDACLAI